MSLFRKSHKIEIVSTTLYGARYNEYGQTTLSLLENINGDLLQTRQVLIGDSFDLYRWQRENRVSDDQIIWGSPERDSVLRGNHKYGFSQ